MHNLLTTTTDLLRVITGSAADVDCIVSFIEYTTASPPVLDAMDTQFTNIVTATTTTVLGAPTSGSDRRRIKAVSIVNKHATVSTTVRVIIERTGPVNWDLFNTVDLAPGESLTFTEGTGWFLNKPTAKLNAFRFVDNDVAQTNVTPTFADITGLTCPVESGKHYAFEAHLFHFSSGTTIGARYAVNGPAMTGMRLQGIEVILGSVTAATMAANVADVTALDTAVIAETTGAATTPVLQILSGWINPSAAGTFAVRGCVEATGTLTTKKGSWLRIWEAIQG